VSLQQLLEAPLHHPDMAVWKDESRQKPAEFDQWLDAQRVSLMAAEYSPSLHNHVFPLSKAKNTQNLETVWRIVNMVISGFVSRYMLVLIS
jgi:hypothetical protein